ncbi:MAG: hypothetical protein HOE76_05205 [Euryarchaeota archaeon]|jgi:hypothetical protein|nr:hypothetical protein [Euryarchaeota archaeon]MBT4982149.1 hypothetical protein [Euryarchaeota archaeon]MBT5184834.1 hypothetical protein [Euryarchaeota archaeon]
MNDKQTLLSDLHQARLDRLKEICAEHGLSRNGSVEVLRARLIADLVLDEWDLSPEGIESILNNDLGGVLAVFGVKKSGSIRERRQRLFLHLNHDAKQLTPEKLDTLSRDDLHNLCLKLDLPRSGAKQALLMRVAGVLTSQNGSWGVIKKSLRRPRGEPKAIQIPSPSDEYESANETKIQPQVVVAIEESAHVTEVEVVEDTHENEEVQIIEISPSPMPEIVPESPVVELTESVIVIEGRIAEIDALCRDYLLVGSINDTDDVNAFISSLSEHGLPVNDENAADFVKARLYSLDSIAKAEKDAMHTLPNSWREREALRRFEEARGTLREILPEMITSTSGDMIKARMAFEEKARELNLDLRLPSVSGRLHALFDLQISLDEEIAATDPRTARRTRVVRLLQHGAIHLQSSERRTLDRLERNIEGFEQLVEAILEKSEGSYNDAQQTLVIRFLEKKGYDVNNAELRPRVVAAAGIIGAELGHISPSEIPRIAPGIKVSDTEVDSIIADLKRLAQQFKPKGEPQDIDEDIQLAESVADASDRIASMRNKIDGVDELLARLNISDS